MTDAPALAESDRELAYLLIDVQRGAIGILTAVRRVRELMARVTIEVHPVMVIRPQRPQPTAKREANLDQTRRAGVT